MYLHQTRAKLFNLLDICKKKGAATPRAIPPETLNSATKVFAFIRDIGWCSRKYGPEGYTLYLETGKIYLLRIVNAAVNEELFFIIAGHKLTIVEVDAPYTKPFETEAIFIGLSQTTNALLAADQSIGKYLIAISPFMGTIAATDNQIATGILCYNGIVPFSATSLTAMPSLNATKVTSSFMDSLRNLNSKTYPTNAPTEDRPLIVVHHLCWCQSMCKPCCG
ncbi:unnamed protein product [Fraxinus pennsylvanica]|uniref:Plastocyanin-like domain-containing protein n=1 Tax=Fraxinus pennsylvanica TaxID=56036 RepID=A0AAD1ZEG7_9LAMI|nr:unnamed protein product [Fraxinus pennsylvanica]